MSKYALATPSGRIEEALRFLGMSGPLSMSEDALEALDDLQGRAERFEEALAAERESHNRTAGRSLAKDAALAAFREALLTIAGHTVVSEGDTPADNCDWHCSAEMVKTALDALGHIDLTTKETA